jgi:hypothetical protein
LNVLWRRRRNGTMLSQQHDVQTEPSPLPRPTLVTVTKPFHLPNTYG